MITKLNLGCGAFKKEGYLNVDWQAGCEPDVHHDLNVLPYPFEADRFTRIEADHLLEHLDAPFEVMRELYRIGRPGCRIVIRVPHFSRGFTHGQHRRGFDVSFPLYFDPSFQGGYQGVPLSLVKMRLRWFAQPYLKRTLMSAPVFHLGVGAGVLLDVAANLFPYACSRLWCFWVGGFDEIAFEFEVEKENRSAV